MKLFFNTIIGLIISISLFGQDDVRTLVSQGTTLHDQGKYDEAITKYMEALNIDKNSTLANYELSFTYMTIGNYNDAIKFSKKVIEQNSNNLNPAYVVLGTSLDLKGKHTDAIKVYEEGLTKFPNSNLLNYNLALTALNIGDYSKAEQAAINAIIAKPTHSSSHLVLANIMKAQGERVKALLPLYYFLLLEPTSKRSLVNLHFLQGMLDEGVEQKSNNTINITVPSFASKDSVWGAAEMMISLLGASKYSDKNKSQMEIFIETTESLFNILGELKKNNSSLWWDLYVTKFYDLVQLKNNEAFSYYISQSTDSQEVNKWITDNPDKMKIFLDWMKKN